MRRYTFFAVLITALFLFFFPALLQHGNGLSGTPSLHVNLQDFPLYLRSGFTPLDTIAPDLPDLPELPDLEDASWQKLFPFSNVIIRNLALPDLPERTFLSPFSQEEREFTFVIPFFLADLDRVTESSLPGIFLACIGDNWEIYLNGTLIQSEMHLEKDSLRIRTHRSQRDTFFPFSGSLLRNGLNILAFHIVGDPTDRSIGLQYSSPYYIGEYKIIRKNNSETLEMILIGGYMLIAAYLFLLFAIHSKDIHNLYCGAFSSLMGFYYLFRTHSIYHYIPDTAVVVKLEFFCLFFVIPALGAFVETLCSGKVSPATKIYSALFAFLALSQLFLPRPYGSDALVVWQILAIAALLYLLVAGIVFPFIREVRTHRKENALRGLPGPRLTWFLAETYTGNLLIAVSIIIASAIIDIVDSLLFHHSLNLTHYSLYVFAMAVTLMLARTYGRLNHALQAKSAFLANMSHDIRTPLNAITGTVEVLLRHKPDPEVRAGVERIKQAASILASIINDILDLSRLEAGRLAIVRQEYGFAPFINEIADMIGPELMNKGIRFTVELDPAIPQTLVGDASRIRQILLNLLWNAVKFTSRGEVALQAAWNDSGSGQGKLVLAVKDTGLGVKRENLPNIFTEFFQADPLRSRNAEGIGLGLTICKNLCTLMGGEIKVQSEYGRGSLFTVSLPQEPGTGALPREAHAKALLLEQGVSLPSARVLIVDDLESNRHVLQGLLAPYGMRTDVATSGKEALDMAVRHVYDLVFMDHIMGGDMDGIAAAKALRKLQGCAQTPIVALTANAMKGMREFFLEQGFQEYIAKPVDHVALDAAIARLVPEEKRQCKTAASCKAQAPPEPAAPKPAAPGLPAPVQHELEREWLNLLRHYQWHFANEPEVDTAYCARVGLLLRNLDIPGLPPSLRQRMQALAAAGRRLDAAEMRRTLPTVCDGLLLHLEGEQRADPEPPEKSLNTAPDSFRDTLCRLKEALQKGDAQDADQAMGVLRTLPWPKTLGKETRELYFFLYDALMLEKMEQASGALALWRRIFGHIN